MTDKVLIVDDEPANIRLLERLFRDDYLCLTASSGNEAMDLLDVHEVAVIISVQRMPQMTGLELLKRSADRRPHMVRILLTGYTDLDALVEAVNCGLVYMYVSKPLTNDDLKVRVSRAVEHYENNKRQHSLAANNKRLESRLNEMKVGLLRMAAVILQLQDPYLCLHAVRVSKYAELVVGPRFTHIHVHKSTIDGFDQRVEIGVAGQENSNHVRAPISASLQQFEARHLGHTLIRDDDRHFMHVQQVHRLIAGRRCQTEVVIAK